MKEEIHQKVVKVKNHLEKRNHLLKRKVKVDLDQEEKRVEILTLKKTPMTKTPVKVEKAPAKEEKIKKVETIKSLQEKKVEMTKNLQEKKAEMTKNLQVKKVEMTRNLQEKKVEMIKNLQERKVEMIKNLQVRKEEMTKKEVTKKTQEKVVKRNHSPKRKERVDLDPEEKKEMIPTRILTTKTLVKVEKTPAKEVRKVEIKKTLKKEVRKVETKNPLKEVKKEVKKMVKKEEINPEKEKKNHLPNSDSEPENETQ